MAKIKQLSEHLSNRIAAGEVVERPAGVIKELVENAIDAGATEISVSFEDGGLASLQVSDNGSGMDKEDLRRAFMRHSTSKINQEADLFRIATLGFRGEALPSIASVARVDVISRGDDSTGYRYVIDNGQEVLFEPASHGRGTTIKVSELFYKVPARLKYMKTPSSESARVMSILNSFALGYPEIAFTVMSQGRIRFQSRGSNDLKEVMYQLYGGDIAGAVQSFAGESSNFKVSGVYVLPHINRGNRRHIYYYLNGRMIYYYPMNQVVDDVFHRYMPSDRYPLLVVNIESDVQLIDVNVHPSKTQVKVSQERELLDLVSETLGSTLRFGMRPKDSFVKRGVEALNIFEMPDERDDDSVLMPQVFRRDSGISVLGNHHGKYILAEDVSGLYLFDQHAAMERVQYEKFQKRMKKHKHAQQLLTVPIVVSRLQYPLEDLEKFLDFGLEVEVFSESDFVVRSVPLWAQGVDAKSFVFDVLELLREEYHFDVLKLNDHKLATMACKSSIKFNERRTHEELQRIVDDLMLCEQPYHCPHGRPTFVKIDPASLLKEFKR